MRSNPDKALLNFQSNHDSWNSILQFPYWLRLGRDIDLDHIRVFTRNNGQEFGSTKVERQAYLQKIMQGEMNYSSCHRLMVTIPKSLCFESVIKIIDYAHKNSHKTLFVCETPAVAVMIKEILVDRSLHAYKQVSAVNYNSKDYFYRERYLNECFISVDPEYYSNFMLDTPTNKVFWHRYDYTGNYKFRKKEPASLDYVIDRAIEQNTHDGVIDYERINKQLLGSYSSKEEVLPISIPITEFMYEYSDFRCLPECKNMGFTELRNYVDNHFPNFFSSDESDYQDINTCDNWEEGNLTDKEEVYKKCLEFDEDDELPFN